METRDYVFLVIAFILSYVIMVFTRKYLINRRFFKPFINQSIFEESAAKKFNDIFVNSPKAMELMPYLNFFQMKIVLVTSDNRLYLDRKAYNKLVQKHLLIAISVFLLLLLLLALVFQFVY